MSTVIVLSSSPPPVFARSPTPADPSPLPSSAAIVQGHSASLKRFKTTKRQRDGFSSPFTTARHVLGDKCGAENLAIQSPGRNRFRSSQEGDKEVETHGRDARTDSRNGSPIAKPSSARWGCPQMRQDNLDSQESARNTSQAARSQAQTQVVESHFFLQRAVPRRLDWTPPKLNPPRDENQDSTTCAISFGKSIMDGFEYIDNPRSQARIPAPETVKPAKRRRIESSTTRVDESQAGSISAPKSLKKTTGTAKTAPKRTRSPAKKALTITALATSHLAVDNDSADSPMMQYLTSTQAQSNAGATDSVLETKVQRTRTAAKKLKDSKTKKAQSSLLSPKSAMKSFDSQEAIFGSASQLAREDSPALLRETIKAMKESESFIGSDPFSSPQRTQQATAENTPKQGTIRFKRTRNLWAAAGRDEDNALLHVDVVDLADTPAVRAAFAGKDVMLQPGVGRASSPSRSGLSLKGRCSPLVLNHPVIDIFDIDTPHVTQKRRLSSPAKSYDHGHPSLLVSEESAQNPLPQDTGPAKTREPPPPKPNYAGYTTHDLQKQIKSFGFKALRKREKMIELLDRCWEEKYGPTELAAAEPEVVPFGDFLSKVHDLSARPEPKVKKPRAKKQKDDSEKTPKEKPARKPRQRKKKDTELVDGEEVAKETKPKATRKRKSKAAIDAEKSILDIDDIDDTIPEELRALGQFEDWAKPARKPRSKPRPTPTSAAATQPPTALNTTMPTHPPTPPATLPLITIPTSSPGFDDPNPVLTLQPNQTPQSPALPPLTSQITTAIKHQSTQSLSHNHNTHPTWHEKMLLYDPIVLEDLALWLNTEGLGAIGEDREVSALEVREWCESRGVCCLWKGGWRGNAGR